MKKTVVLLTILCSIKSQAQIFFGFTAGIETNKVLGTAYPFGFDMDVKTEKNMFGFYFNLNLGNSPESEFFIQDKTNIYNVNTVSSAIFGLEYGRVLYESNYFLFETVAGVGYKDTTYYEDEDQGLEYDKRSIVLSTGLSLRYLGENFYVELKPLYCYTNHHQKLLSERIPSNMFKLNLIVGDLIGH